ncbi:hypothetical protein DENSPDRAFT_835849 [Dentipellis sp. KUC8613]|nr:hypothetical protein DENSPDRAFT_835849 [Dentipellis sp. KUC8613]
MCFDVVVSYVTHYVLCEHEDEEVQLDRDDCKNKLCKRSSMHKHKGRPCRCRAYYIPDEPEVEVLEVVKLCPRCEDLWMRFLTEAAPVPRRGSI